MFSFHSIVAWTKRPEKKLSNLQIINLQISDKLASLGLYYKSIEVESIYYKIK